MSRIAIHHRKFFILKASDISLIVLRGRLSRAVLLFEFYFHRTDLEIHPHSE
jgi:hypothetical protein